VLDEIASATKAMARELNVRGLMNVQFAVKGEDVLRAGSESARLAAPSNVSKRLVYRLANWRRSSYGGQNLLRELGLHRNHAETFLGERSRLPVSALSRR